MKAVCALVCLALAHGVSANIFKKSHRPDDADSLIVQPLDYINQYQRPLYQPQEQTYKQYIRAQKQKIKHADSTSTSSQESQEKSHEKISNEQKYVTLRTGPAGARSWDAPLYTAFMKVRGDVTPSFADSMVWRGLHQMPVESASSESSVVDEKTIQKIFVEATEVMKHPTAEDKVAFHDAYTVAAESEDGRLNATELLQKNDYPVEEHTVKTDDGYLLTLFRIPAKKQIRDVTPKPVVFLMHGLLGSADDWLLMGPGKALAYLLADAGYEVWLGNARGNKYSRQHASKYPALADFWQFGNDEVALHDLPAMIDYALKTSGQQKLHYVGHAQGSTVFFALAAARPAYNDKIISMHALSPMAYMSNARSPLIRMIAPTSPFESKLHHQIGHGEFEPTVELIATVGGDMCQEEIGCKNVCSNVNFVMSGINIENVDGKLAAAIVHHLPAGGSTRTIKHYGQAVSSGEFRKYDFGPKINQEVYGTVEPPKYEMSKVTVPVALYAAAADWLSQPADVARLQSELPHSETYEVPDAHFSHMDFQFSTKAPALVYKKLIDSMKEHSY